MTFQQTIHRIMRSAIAAQYHEHDSFRNPRKTFFVARMLVAIAQYALAHAEIILHDPWLANSREHGNREVVLQHADCIRSARALLDGFPQAAPPHVAGKPGVAA